MKTLIFKLLFLLSYIQLFSQTIEAPIDYRNPQRELFKLEYEFGETYNPKLPTVIVVSDAQQFYVRKGRIKKIQYELFGKNINVLGLITRGSNQDLLHQYEVIKEGVIDWRRAYLIFQSYQFANDVNLLITEVLKDQEDIYLYGQSGGAFLITEYLSIFPNSRVKKVFLGASANPVIENKLGIIHDNFQRDYISKNELDKTKLENVLAENFFERKLVASLFQRQNFFVKLSELNNKRSELITHLNVRDTTFINKLKKEYQIDAIKGLLNSEAGIPIRVRLAEFIYPLLEDWKNIKRNFYPDLENSYNIAYPIIELNNQYAFPIFQSFNKESFSKYKGEVFILSGRYDHIADYRSSIYMDALLENSTLFIANDDHTFKLLKSENKYAELIQSFFEMNSPKDWKSRYGNYQWKEK